MFDEFHWSRVCSESFLPQVYSLPYLCPKHPIHRRWIIPLGIWVVFLENYFNTYFCWVDGCRCCTCYLCESNPDPPPQIYLNNMPSFLLLFSPSLSPVWLFVTPWTAALQAFLFFTISQNLLKFMSIESVMLYNHLILCRPLRLLPSIFPSIMVFSNKLAPCSRWPKYWSFSFSTVLPNEYSGLVSFRIDSFDLLAIQGTLKTFPAPQFKRWGRCQRFDRKDMK